MPRYVWTIGGDRALTGDNLSDSVFCRVNENKNIVLFGTCIFPQTLKFIKVQNVVARQVLYKSYVIYEYLSIYIE